MNGIVGYLLTPCDASGQVDHALLARHVERLVNLGVHGLAPLGSVGCLPYLGDGERDAVIRTTVAAAAGRVPVLAGVSSLGTAQTIRHARFAQEAGASAIQVLPSTYWTLTEAEIFEYYRQVAEAVSIPVMVYNNPFTTGLDLPVDFLRRLTALPNVSLIKEASPDGTKIARLREACPDHVGIFVGLNRMAQRGFQDGAAGWCTAAPNVCASFILNFHRCMAAGDVAGAQRWFARQSELLNFLMDHGLPRTVTAGLELCGVPAGRLRAPLSPLTPALHTAMKDILETMEII
ncbi:dihydrodipicolinate synthase family protein [Hydrogenophaga sp. UC242_50]|uniref:dihydrodipicolinate synthase family protein n=1 Tax=unclassified Hydrogenophaga TaxID=2610897 RepID=UPI0036D370F1